MISLPMTVIGPPQVRLPLSSTHKMGLGDSMTANMPREPDTFGSMMVPNSAISVGYGAEVLIRSAVSSFRRISQRFPLRPQPVRFVGETARGILYGGWRAGISETRGHST